MKFLIFLLISISISAQQIPDTLYQPKIEKKYNATIYVDHAHRNFHRIDNRFLPFAKVLRSAGYKVKSFNSKFTQNDLKKIKTLVISNALSEESRQPFVVPTPSAFTKKEISNIKQWVNEGGSLFLIADHMPFAGASAKLAQAFNFTFYDSFLLDENRNGILEYTKKDKTLEDSMVSIGVKGEGIQKIRTFTGQAFKIPNKAISILKTKEKDLVYLSDTMWRFSEKTKRFSAKGLSQGAIMKVKKGRIAVFGEAGMFTAQLAGRNRFKVGMNSPKAAENYKLLLEIIEWLTKQKEKNE